MPVIILEKEADFSGHLASGPCLVDFTAAWCGPCQRIKPELATLSDSVAGKCKIIAVDVDKFGDLTGKYEVTAMPTFVLFENGKEVNRCTGANKDAIQQLVTKYM